MKRIQPTFTIMAASVAGLLFAGNIAQGAGIWDSGGGADTAVEQPLNWDTDALPLPSNTITIANGGTAVYSVTTGTNSVQRTDVNGGSTLYVTGGRLNDTQSGNTIRNNVGVSGNGTVLMSGGYWDIGHILRIGSGSGNNGSFTLSGGDVSIGRGGNALAGEGNFFANSPVVTASMGIGVSSGTGSFTVSGGSLSTRVGVGLGSGGTFTVLGNGATSIGIGSVGDGDGHWYQNSGAVLSMGIGATGVTKIFIDEVGDNGGNFAAFLSGSLLNLFFHGTSAYSGTWTLLELENAAIQNGGLALTAATQLDPNWTFNVDNTGPNGLLTATYTVPEPSTLALMVCAFGGLLAMRRKSA